MFRAANALLLSMLWAPALVIAQSSAEFRTGFIQCGQAQITARAECHGKTAYCQTETLTFSRTNSRSIAPLHRNYALHELSGRKVKALDYHAAAWACVPGKSGGSYLVVLMRRTGGGNCSECEYSRLYDLNGRLIAADLGFDARGLALDNKPGRDMMYAVLGSPGPHVFIDVYL